MTEADDIELLRQYAGENSEPAFAALVGRHVNFVYSVALRRTGDPHAAEEITQAVFIILARKAKSFPRKTILTGWLHATARLTAANFLRAEIRRQHREQEAFMQSAFNETETWTQIAPLLDDAISKLGARDRDAILLRYFENKSAREMAAALRVDEPAAQKRVTRAVEKLRMFFAKRGVTLTAAAIAGAVSANSVQAAPVGLAATVTAAAAKGAAVSTSTLTLIKGAMKMMAWTKVQTAVALVMAAIFVAGIATVAIEKFPKKVAIKKFPINSDPWLKMEQFQNVFGELTQRQNFEMRQLMAEHDEEGLREMSDNNAIKMKSSFVDFFKQLPEGILIRPTHYNESGAMRTEDKRIERMVSLSSLLGIAYETNSQELSPVRMILPAGVQTGNFDYLVNVPDHWQEKFQAQIKKQFGLVGRMETLTTNVLLLRLGNPDAPRLLSESQKTSSNYEGGKYSFMYGSRYKIMLGDTASMADTLERQFFHQPVLDQTDFENIQNQLPETIFYAVPSDSNDLNLLRRVLLEQLGLELVPTNMPIEMLVVEKVNNN
jgi:uncharacterized protein (TIGR03435 family)